MKGIIVSSICGTYKVLIKGQEYNVTARGLFKHHKRKLIVGDYVEIDEKAQENLETDLSQEVLRDFVSKAADWEWTEENLHEKLEQFRGFYKEKGIKPKVTMWAIRAAVTGRTRGADMVGTLVVLGKDTSLYRANKAIK